MGSSTPGTPCPSHLEAGGKQSAAHGRGGVSTHGTKPDISKCRSPLCERVRVHSCRKPSKAAMGFNLCGPHAACRRASRKEQGRGTHNVGRRPLRRTANQERPSGLGSSQSIPKNNPKKLPRRFADNYPRKAHNKFRVQLQGRKQFVGASPPRASTQQQAISPLLSSVCK